MAKRKRHKTRGVNTGLGICSFFAYLFEANTIFPKKLTDEEIALRVSKEFPSRKSAQAFIEKRRTVNEYRQRYHRGDFTGFNPPPKFSFRYDSTGNIVDGRKGRRVLTNIEILGLQSQQKYWHDKQTVESIRESSS